MSMKDSGKGSSDALDNKSTGSAGGNARFILLSVMVAVIVVALLVIAAWVLTRGDGNNVNVAVQEAGIGSMVGAAPDSVDAFSDSVSPSISVDTDVTADGAPDAMGLVESSSHDPSRDVDGARLGGIDLSNDPRFQAIISKQPSPDSSAHQSQGRTLLKSRPLEAGLESSVQSAPRTSRSALDSVKHTTEVDQSAQKNQHGSVKQSRIPPIEPKSPDSVVTASKRASGGDSGLKSRVPVPKDPSHPRDKLADGYSKAPGKSMDPLNGQLATKGHYLQVGAFTQEANRIFLDKISKYSYRVEREVVDGKTLTKYLIGPYPSRIDVTRDVHRITVEIGKAFYRHVE